MLFLLQMTLIVLLKFGEHTEDSVYYVPFYTKVKVQLHMMWNLVLILITKGMGMDFTLLEVIQFYFDIWYEL